LLNICTRRRRRRRRREGHLLKLWARGQRPQGAAGLAEAVQACLNMSTD